MNVPAKTVKVFRERDSQRCAACGVSNALSTQHRINKGSGGDPKGYRNILSNLLTLCVLCNGALESDERFRASGISNGWKAMSWDDPLRVAVYYMWAREWRLLDDQGGYRVVDDSEIVRGKNGAPLV